MDEKSTTLRRGADLIPVKSTESWSISLSRKERCVYIATDDYHAGPLRLTRDELYELGRMMSRKSRKAKKGHVSKDL